MFRFDGSQWIEDAKLQQADGVLGDEFGIDVALEGNRAVIGCRRTDDLGHDSGAAYVFDLDCIARLDIWPHPLVAGKSAMFWASGITPDERTYLVYSTTGLGQTNIPFLNITLDLENPKQAGPTRTADAFGRVQWYLPIPQNALGWHLWFQTAQFENKTRTVATFVVR